MGHRITLMRSENREIVSVIEIPAFDSVTSYLAYLVLDAIDYWDGVNGDGREMDYTPDKIVTDFKKMLRFVYSLNSDLERIKDHALKSKGGDKVKCAFENALGLISRHEDDSPEVEVGEVGKSLKDKIRFLGEQYGKWEAISGQCIVSFG